MLPDIKSKNWEHNLIENSLHERIVLVWSSDNLEFIPGLVDANPDPSGSKDGSRSGLSLEFGLHFIHRSKGLVDQPRELVGRLGLLGFIWRGHFGPEEGVVVVSTPTVTDRAGLQGIRHQVKDWDLVLAFGGLVDVGNVCSVVLIVVDLYTEWLIRG